MDSGAGGDVKINGNEQNDGFSSKEFMEERSNSEHLGIPSNSNCWWPNDAEEKLEPRQRWSFGSDISIEAVENNQSRLCCSPVDEFDSTVSSETEDLIVNNTEEGPEDYKPCIQISPACSPTFKNAVCNSNDKKQRKSHEVYTDDDELVDYSKRYTTDNFALMVENKPVDLRAQQQHQQRQQQQQQRRMVMNNINRPVSQKKSVNSRSKGGFQFGDYAETDLDQPTDYSLRYAEEDMCEEDEDDSRFYGTDQPEEDVVRTYYTEGTPSNFSTATSMSDLLILESPREGDEAAYKQQFLGDQKEEKSEKAVKDCKNRIRQKFASDASKNPIREGTRETGDQRIDNGKLEKLRTPPQSPAEICDRSKESKAVSFNVEENNYAQETPLMFSRSSSLDSLSEFEQESIQDDRSSIISDFSHRTSGAVSPSDLPDSPTQTVPPSPRRLERQGFSGLQQQEQPQSQRLAQPRRTDRANVQSLQQPQIPKLQQQQSQAQSLPLSQSQPSRVLIRSGSRNSTATQSPNNGHIPLQELQQHSPGDMRVSLMQRSPAPENQVPLQQHQQMNNRIVLMQRPQPEGQASLVQRPQTNNPASAVQHLKANNRVPVEQRSQAENCSPVVQRPQMIRVTSPAVVQHQHSSREPHLPPHITERCISVFEDNLVRFKDESTQSKFSTAGSCLSSLTIDDEDDNVSIDNREIINRIAAIRVRSSAAGMHQAPCTQTQCGNNNADKAGGRHPQSNVSVTRHLGHRNEGSHVSPSKEELQHYVNVEDESYDYTTCYSNKEVQGNRYRDSSKDLWYHENELKNDNRNQTKAKSPVWKHNNNDIICHLQKVTDVAFVDTVHTYYTEDTPVFVSPYGSQSNLSGLSSLSISDDDFGYGLIEDERHLRSPNFDEVERSNSRADTYDRSEEDSSASEDEDKNYERGSSSTARRRIDVSPFESQMNLNFSLLRIEEEDEEAAEREAEAEEKTNRETDRSFRGKSPASDKYDDDYYRRLSSRTSDCSDDDDEEERQVLEQCIKSGVSKVTRRSLEPTL